MEARDADPLRAWLARPEAPQRGIALGVKDLFDTAGLVTTYGSAIFREHVPERTAEAVRLLEGAGYALVGKTNLHEFAYGITSENAAFGDVANPLDPSRIPGGSSRDRRRRWPPGSATRRSAPTAPARSGCRPRAAASSASSRRTRSSRRTGSFRSRRASTTPGPWPTPSPTAPR